MSEPDGQDTLGLLRRVRAGDADARERFIVRLRPRLVLWAAARMSSELRAVMEPEDVAQEVLVAVHRDLDGFRGEADRRFFGWLFTVAENRVRDLADHHAAKKRKPVPAAAPRRQTGPDAAAERAEMAQRVRDAIAKLPPDHRRVIQHVRLEERDAADVAKLLGRSENAVRILYCRALKELRTLLTRAGE